MSKRMALAGVAVSILALASLAPFAVAPPDKPAAKAGAAKWSPPRTPWGDPDLQGTWPLDQLGRTPLQRLDQYGDRLYFTDEEYKKAVADAAVVAAGAAREEKENKLGGGHWFEYGKPLRQTSMIVEPKNGHLPPLTEKG